MVCVATCVLWARSYVAADAVSSRAPATPGEDKTIAYLSEQFRKAGVQPGGDAGGVCTEQCTIRQALGLGHAVQFARLIALAGTSAPDAALLRAVVEEASELGFSDVLEFYLIFIGGACTSF